MGALPPWCRTQSGCFEMFRWAIRPRMCRSSAHGSECGKTRAAGSN